MLWVQKNTGHNIKSNANTLSTSIVIDFDNDIHIARFTGWDDLSCMSEVICVESGDYKLNQRNEFHTYDSLRIIFDALIESIQ
ncbi:immunity protein TriTu family protein [Escherichia coli]|uniref:immunity protein TriTu family protein n=1 Tax=Escherichia coli TaxID=562 RepID=UPI003EBA9B43